MNASTIATLIVVPVFIVLIQKYVESIASYSSPTSKEIERSGKYSYILSSISSIKLIAMIVANISTFVFIFCGNIIADIIAIVILLVCIVLMSIIVNWRLVFK